MKKRLVTFLTLIFLFFGVSLSAASVDEQWRLDRGNNLTDFKSIVINDGLTPLETYSYLWAETHQGNGNFSRFVCTNTTDKNCNSPQLYNYQAILPMCNNTSDLDCVYGVSTISSSGVSSPGVFKEYSIDKQPNNFIDDLTLGVRHNSNPSIWQITSAPHAGGDLYAVVTGLTGSKEVKNGLVTNRALFAYLVPVSIQKGALQEIAFCRQANSADNVSVSANTRCTGSEFVYSSSSSKRCAIAYGTSGDCLTPEKFPTGFNFNLEIRLAKEPLGWFHGRITSPEISIKEIPTGGTSISVNAQPVQVPAFLSSGLWKDLSAVTQKWWLNDFVKCSENCGPAGGTHADDPRIDVQNSFVELNQYPYGDFSLNLIKTLASEVGDKAVVAPSIWSFKTLKNSGASVTDPCITDGSGLKGIVTTNSTTYSQGAPSFSRGELSYRVASLHNLADGSVFKGTYDLILNSEVARCLYKFSKAPISATIEVVNDSGSNQIATTTVNEKDGWVYLSAKNFTFSSPTVRVKLTQAGEKPVVMPSSSVSVAKKTTITCVKGKTSKKVTAVKPVCPAGFKKK